MNVSESPVVVITPSFRRDFDLFKELHSSFLQYFPPGATHLVAVPPDDLDLFRRVESPQLKVINQLDLMPDGFRYVGVYTRRLATVFRQPILSKLQYLRLWPRPAFVRGWIAQQAVKLSLSARAVSDVVLIVDSDVVFIRPVGSSDIKKMSTELYVARAVVGNDMNEHRIWHRSAEALLGLAHDSRSQLDDYISPCLPWNTSMVRRALSRASGVHEAGWLDAVLRSKEFSECIFYGRFAESQQYEDVLQPAGELALCHWSTSPLTEADQSNFLAGLRERHIAMQIQSTSSTSLYIRRRLAAVAREMYQSGRFEGSNS
ncbi:DUF6492 family protein [Rhodococcus kroppenstedtii]|uniref:DUF6492 family protein n=1 Tax=Rhodococcoides kroppenstedtii TaxID=293050 RepID=UPI0029543F82|nr:DUF6492 family protein [Rhodococcus kroppenstedtii]MDV7198318.1 DUF6492 family protein [Rhodococcus kroppenstedtii]